MLTVQPGQANELDFTLVKRADGAPITSGTVNFYLQANTGTNAAKWYRGSDATWQASEAIAGAASHLSDGHWELSLPAAVWVQGVNYYAYPKETGDLHIPTELDIYCTYGTVATTAPVAGSGVCAPWSVNGLAEQIRGEINMDADAAGGSVPARLSNVIRECGAKLWNGIDWRFRRKQGTLLVAANVATARLPVDFAELDHRWLKETTAKASLMFTDDASIFQSRKDYYDSASTGYPNTAFICQDTTRTTWTWYAVLAPTPSDTITYPYWYLLNDPWTRKASLTTALATANANLTFTAITGGASGNSTTIAYTTGASLTVTVVTAAITIQVLNTGLTTAAQVRTAVRASVQASALVDCDYKDGEDGTGVITAAMSATALAGPIADTASPVWPPTFDQGWHLYSLYMAQRMFRSDDGWEQTRTEFKAWAQEQLEEGNETIATGQDRIIDGYADEGATAFAAFNGGFLWLP